jgi:hypothetical protein
MLFFDLQHIDLWDLYEDRDAHLLSLDELDMEDWFLSDSEMSDSDYDCFF